MERKVQKDLLKRIKFKSFLLAMTFLFMLGTNVSSQILKEERFDYPTGDLLTNHGWVLVSATNNPLTVTANSLTYSGYGKQIGQCVKLMTTGQDLKLVIPTQTANSVYVGFLVNVKDVLTPNDYFFHLIDNVTTTNNFRSRIYIKKDAASGKFAFGISRGNPSSSEPAIFTGYDYDFETTYFLVLKYQFVGTSTDKNDVMALYVNPPTTGIEPNSPNISATDFTTTDLINVSAIALRQGGSSTGPTLLIDEILVTTTWEELFPNTKSVKSFTFNGLTPSVIGQINESEKKIALTVPYGTDIKLVVPNIITSGKSTISPASGIAQDFTNPVN